MELLRLVVENVKKLVVVGVDKLKLDVLGDVLLDTLLDTEVDEVVVVGVETLELV